MRLAKRAGGTVATIAAMGVGIGAAFAGGAAWSSRDHDPRIEGRPDLSLVDAAVRPASSCADLLAHYIDNTVDLVGPYGWFRRRADSLGRTLPATGMEDSAPRQLPAASPALQGSTSSTTGTNVQETGVDEPDVVKTDGSILVRIDGHELTTYDVSGPEPRRLGSIDVPREIAEPELLLAGHRVVVLGQEYEEYDRHFYPMGEEAAVTHQLDIDISDPSSPAVTDQRSYDASLVSVRQHGDVVRLVLGSGLPDLDFVEPGGLRSDNDAEKRNREIVSASTIEDWVPSVTTEDGSTQLADCEDVSIPASAPATGGVYVVGFDADSPAETSVTGLATGTDLAYESASRLYVATRGAASFLCCQPMGRPVPEEDYGRTDLHAFALDGADATYVASGTVDGIVADRWSMDEYEGVLRVAVGPSPATGNFNSILTLREEGTDLVEVGHVHELGVNEQIQSMRWYDGLAVMVTFRQVDPLYAIDLTDPEHPRELGHLKIPGFSAYLHPLGTRRLIGMGQAANGGAQAAVFDLEDLTHPVRQTMVAYGAGTVAAAGADPRQFTWLPDRRIALTVITRGDSGQTGYVSVLTLSDGHLSNRMVRPTTATTSPTSGWSPCPAARSSWSPTTGCPS